MSYTSGDIKPKPETPVIVICQNRYNAKWTFKTLAEWVPKFTKEDTGDFEGDAEYSEEKDQYYHPEGWYEYSTEADTNYMLSAPVLKWMYLPADESSPSYTRAEVAEILEWRQQHNWQLFADGWQACDPFSPYTFKGRITTSALITEYENRPENKDKTV